MRSIGWKMARLSPSRRINVRIPVGRGKPVPCQAWSVPFTVGRGSVPRQANCLKQDFQDFQDFQD